MNVGNGDYNFVIGLFGDTEDDAIEFIDDGPSVYVLKDTTDWGGTTKLEYSWK
jgi:hypothetical protein